MSNSPLEDVLEVIRKYSRPFVGFTVHPHVYSRLARDLKPDYWGRTTFPVPTYCISNQPCEIVQWSNQKLMMKFVRRKERESLDNVSQQKTID